MILPEETEYMTYVAFTPNTMVFLSVHILELGLWYDLFGQQQP